MKNQAYKVAIKKATVGTSGTWPSSVAFAACSKAEAQLKSKAETGDDLQYIAVALDFANNGAIGQPQKQQKTAC